MFELKCFNFGLIFHPILQSAKEKIVNRCQKFLATLNLAAIVINNTKISFAL